MARRQDIRQHFLPYESEARAQGFHQVAGLDEAGRGPLAGPVVAAAVILPSENSILGLQDSKCLTARQRDEVYQRILEKALAYGFGVVSPQYIDQNNILWATKAAMAEAIHKLASVPDLLLIDGTTALPVSIPQRLIVKGDACCTSVAAASVMAKVTRDRLMLNYAREYPLYGFEKHKGYPTADHLARLRRYGPCAIHRHSFRGVLSSTSRAEG